MVEVRCRVREVRVGGRGRYMSDVYRQGRYSSGGGAM